MSDAARVPVLVLDHVQLAAPLACEAAARRFHGELLGLSEIEKPVSLQARGGVWFGLGDGRQLHIGVEDRFAAAAKAHPALAVADAQALRTLADRLATAGARVAWDEERAHAERFYTADPFGNRLELLVRSAEPRECRCRRAARRGDHGPPLPQLAVPPGDAPPAPAIGCASR